MNTDWRLYESTISVIISISIFFVFLTNFTCFI
jgi:hypothetical protein